MMRSADEQMRARTRCEDEQKAKNPHADERARLQGGGQMRADGSGAELSARGNIQRPNC